MSASKRTVPLILIDVQIGFNDPIWGKRNNPNFEHNVRQMLNYWRSLRMPVIHVQHCSKEGDSPLRADREGVRFMEFIQPRSHEPVLTKSVNSAFIGTDLEARLRDLRAERVVCLGLTTDHCVSTSVRMASNLGFNVVVVEDATATFDRIHPDGSRFEAELVHRVSLASLHREFASVLPVREIVGNNEEIFSCKI